MKKIFVFILKKFIDFYNAQILLFKKNTIEKSDDRFLNEIREKATKLTDINEHLETIYNETISINPQLIVELGVRGGESTFVFEKAAKKYGSQLLSVDIEDIDFKCNYEKWKFYKGDDVKLGKDFQKFAKENKLPEKIDVLFIDTSHLYNHTVEEIKQWFPHLNEKSIVIFHDTNISTIFKRKDGTIGGGWNNERGVIRAIEEYFGMKLNEKQSFAKTINNFQVTHYSYCNGLTILKKIK